MKGLPNFVYHPDPVGTGMVEASDVPCEVCDQTTGFAYTGIMYAVDEVEVVCPWCIASGRAADAFDGVFTDVAPPPDDVPAAVVEEITRRTPGFSGWQQEEWLFHCRDGAAYLGRVGRQELEQYPDAIDSLRQRGQDYLVEHLHRDGNATGYLFRCRHCGAHLAYADFT